LRRELAAEGSWSAEQRHSEDRACDLSDEEDALLGRIGEGPEEYEGELRRLNDQVTSDLAQLEKELEVMRRDFEEREREFEAENTELKNEVVKLRAEMEAILKELQDLMDTKLGLELEIAAYRKLLEGEENRVGLRQVVESMMMTQSSSHSSNMVEQDGADAGADAGALVRAAGAAGALPRRCRCRCRRRCRLGFRAICYRSQVPCTSPPGCNASHLIRTVHATPVRTFKKRVGVTSAIQVTCGTISSKSSLDDTWI